MNDELVDSFIEVRLTNPECFLKIAESLTRIGVCATTDKRLYQTCHILHKRGKYYIVHFKEMLALDGNKTNFSTEDRQRRNRIANLLSQWKLLTILTPIKDSDLLDMSKVKVIPFSEKRNWELIPKYRVGK